MTKIEMVEFESWDAFAQSLLRVREGKEEYKTYSDGNGNVKKKKLISHGRIYIGNNWSININETQEGKVYLSVDYFTAEDRIQKSKRDKETSNLTSKPESYKND